MRTIELKKWDIAEEQLFLAIELYLEGTKLISVITLAGAAEEILGKLVASSGNKNAFEEKLDNMSEVFKAVFGDQPKRKEFIALQNDARNQMKHIGNGEAAEIDLEQEAMDLIDRAIANYVKLNPGYVDLFRQFERECVKRIKEQDNGYT